MPLTLPSVLVNVRFVSVFATVILVISFQLLVFSGPFLVVANGVEDGFDFGGDGLEGVIDRGFGDDAFVGVVEFCCNWGFGWWVVERSQVFAEFPNAPSDHANYCCISNPLHDKFCQLLFC
jgi:hypothetical protein